MWRLIRHGKLYSLMAIEQRLVADCSNKAIQTIDYLPPVAALSTVFGTRLGFAMIPNMGAWYFFMGGGDDSPAFKGSVNVAH